MKKFLPLIVAMMLAFAASAQSSQPYSQWYGANKTYDEYTPHSEVTVRAPINCDVIVIIRHNNKDGRVAGHRYIRRGSTGTIQLANGTYQVFFYYGTDWSSQVNMGDGIRGGFTRNVQYSKDNPEILNNDILTYKLTLQRNGNFNTKPSNKNEVF
ncbi:MAG: hypothetical protein IJ764_02755 [Bacteroidales bacterium]|nr:hypothetical protein [Bacteroidales bacterium]